MSVIHYELQLLWELFSSAVGVCKVEEFVGVDSSTNDGYPDDGNSGFEVDFGSVTWTDVGYYDAWPLAPNETDPHDVVADCAPSPSLSPSLSYSLSPSP